MKDKMNMKRIALIMAALAILVTGCSKGKKYTLTGSLETANFKQSPDSLILVSDDLPNIYTIPVKDGAFSFSGRVVKPVVATLKEPGKKVVNKPIVLEKGTITFENGYPRGTPLNEAFYELSQQVKETIRANRENQEAIPEALSKLYRDYLTQHSDDPSAVIALMSARRYMKPDMMSELIALTSKSVQNDSHIDKIKMELRMRGAM
jgi:hypothetical protein